MTEFVEASDEFLPIANELYEKHKDINSNIKNVELITYGKGLQFGY